MLTPMASFGYLKKRGVLFHTWAKLTYTGIVLADYMPCMVHMHALKVSHSVILYVHNSDFSEIAINHVLESTVWIQCDNIILKLIVLDELRLCFLVMAWFAHLKHCCGTFQLDFTDDRLVSAWSASPCILELGSTQQVQVLTAKLHSKHAILANWI